jgi:multicomponent Na+:H+ antiporter subunit D
MLIAMGIAAFLCLFIGIYPAPLYDILPYPDAHYIPYTGAHVIGQLQLLMFGALAFCLLILSGHYPAELRSINLDTDWFYRKGSAFFYRCMDKGLNSINRVCDNRIARQLTTATIKRVLQLPSQIAFGAAVFIQRSSGKKPSSIDKKHFNAAFKIGAIPVGIGAALAAFFVVLLFFLS